jgi:hypothetical protein
VLCAARRVNSRRPSGNSATSGSPPREQDFLDQFQPGIPATGSCARTLEMHRFEWLGQSGIECHLGYGDWIRLLRANGFEVLDLIEIRAPDGLTGLRSDGLVDPDWARKWPAERIWKARKSAGVG